MAYSTQLVDPVFFSQLEGLELRSRSIVEGFMHGLHRSPFVGFSVEFNSHREYVQGDDLRHVNWKLYARQRRLYVKEFDAETNMNLYLMLDISGSMQCANGSCSKLEYGSALAAALTHLALKQHDAVGITLFADRVLSHLKPSAKPHQLQEILQTISAAKQWPVSNAARALHQCAELAPHRGLVVIISDLFDDLDALLHGMEHIMFQNHEVLLFHVLDPWERDLPLEGNIRFHDLETGEEITTQAESVREHYLESINQWREELNTACLRRGIDRVELTTNDPLDQALIDYLDLRTKRY
jgi:uncharacterized protein (DUF58 family)